MIIREPLIPVLKAEKISRSIKITGTRKGKMSRGDQKQRNATNLLVDDGEPEKDNSEEDKRDDGIPDHRRFSSPLPTLLLSANHHRLRFLPDWYPLRDSPALESPTPRQFKASTTDRRSTDLHYLLPSPLLDEWKSDAICRWWLVPWPGSSDSALVAELSHTLTQPHLIDSTLVES